MINNAPTPMSERENFLLSLLNKVTQKYKALLNIAQKNKPLKIVEIVTLSTIPGESVFVIQLTNKNITLKLTAAEIIEGGYDLMDFSQFHANMIREAAKGNLFTFLKLSDIKPLYRIISKQFDRRSNQYLFTIEATDQLRFVRSAEEISLDKNLLRHMDINDIYDIGFTQGSESILKEKTGMLLAKAKK